MARHLLAGPMLALLVGCGPVMAEPTLVEPMPMPVHVTVRAHAAPIHAETAAASTGARSPGPTSQPEGRLRLGHYSLVDGSDGFVLDQTGSAPLFRRDGTDEVLVLDRRRGYLDSTELTNELHGIWIRLTRSGGVLFDGPNQIHGERAYRDADAAQLQ
jgi:hypothetical protein